MVDLSISIVNYNGQALLPALLDSIFRQTTTISFEVLVLDNASADSSVQLLRSRYPQVQLLQNPENVYYAGGNNLNLKRAQGRYFLVSNTDIEFLPGSLDAMVRWMDQHPDVGILGPQVLNLQGDIQESGCRFHTVSYALHEYLFLNQFFPHNGAKQYYTYAPWDRREGRDVDFVGGACFVIRRELFQRLNGFDSKNFVFYQEEADLCRRAHQLGARVFYTPEIQVKHHQGATTRSENPWKIFRLRHRSFLNYFKKYEGWPVYFFLLPFYAFHLSVVWLRRQVKS